MVSAQVERMVNQVLKPGLLVPDDDDFGSLGFLPAPTVEKIADALIPKEFGPLAAARIVYFWKQKGGVKGGKSKFGECSKPSGLTAYLTEGADFIIWLAADNVREAMQNGRMDERDLEALVYHELSHARLEVDDKGNDKWVVVGHDWEGFTRELEVYGPWHPDLTQLHAAMKQLPLIPAGS